MHYYSMLTLHIKLTVVELELKEKGTTVRPRVGVTVTVEGKHLGMEDSG